MKIGFVTCAADKLKSFFPTLAEPHFLPSDPLITPDDQLAVDDLRANGVKLEPIVWGSEINQLNGFDLIIVRSPWDYMDSPENKIHFMQWVTQLEAAGILVANPAPLMQWLLDKHYLSDLAQQDVAVIPTDYYGKSSSLDLKETFVDRGALVLKPCISAAGIGLFFISSQEDALQFQSEFNQRLKTSNYMLQDFVPEIKTHGEWSLVFLGGEYSHAVHKRPGPNSILVHGERGGSIAFNQQVPEHIIRFAKYVHQQIIPSYTRATGQQCDANLLLYLRIDIIETKHGPVVIECEGVEPELFFRAQAQSEKRFSQAIKKLLQK